MNKTLGTFAVIGGSALLLVVIAGITAVSFNNNCIGQETGLEATWEDSQVQYDKFWKTVREQAQITDKYADDFKAIFLGSIEGRYEGKDPAAQFLMESNPGLDSAMYQQLARTVEAGRNDFARTQRTLVDKKRGYKKTLQQFPGSLMASSFGFPRETTGKYAPPRDADGDGTITVLDYETITSSKTQDVFQSGREDEALDVFGDKQEE
jgi:hypothetical protein